MSLSLLLCAVVTMTELSGLPIGLERLERLVETFPLMEPGVQARYFSSFDRTGGNDDGFRGTYSALYVDAKGEHVIFDVEQPGCLYTLWFTSDQGGHGRLNWGRIRFYFDHESEPRIDLEANELFDGKHAPFLKPLVAGNRESTGGYVSYVPLPFAQSLRITTERRVGFYNAFYHLYPHGTEVRTWQADDDSARVRKSWEKALSGAPQALPGERHEVSGGEWSHQGSGVVTRLAVRCARGLTDKALQEGRVVCEWDGRTCVDVPLGVFFGIGLAPTSVRSLVWFADRTKLVSVLPMPFWQSATIRVTCPEPVTLEVDLAPQRYEQATSGYLRAQYREERPTRLGEDFEHADVRAAGKVVAVVQAIEPGDPHNKQWWEGDLRVYVDAERSPAMHGTGHEDDFLGGWSNEFLDTPFTLPMHGEPYVKMLDRTGQYNGDCSLYRLFVGVPFTSRIRWSTEHGTENHRNFDYSGALFWYEGGPKAVETDRFLVCDQASRETHGATLQNVSDPETLTSRFEGRDHNEHTQMVAASLGKSEFTLKIRPDNRGVFLMRLFDQFHGRQRARVSVDGQFVGTWYTAEENRTRRWSERSLFLPARYTAGKSSIRITIDPPASSPLWSHSSYTAYCLCDDE